MKVFLVLGLVSLSLMGCGRNWEVPNTPIVQEASQSTVSQETETPTVTPQSFPQVFLWVPTGADAKLSDEIQLSLISLASQEGLSFEKRENLTVANLTTDVKVVVAMAPAPELQTLVAAAPQTQFIAVNVPDLEPAGNLHLIVSSPEIVQQQAFLAGYLAALVTDDYRVGVIVQSGSETGQLVADAFFTGARYFCGLCNSRYAPIMYYPILVEVEDSSEQPTWQQAADALMVNDVKMVYIQGELVSVEFLNNLMEAGFKIISPESPGDSLQKENWVGTLRLDVVSVLETMWMGLLNGDNNISQASAITLVDTEASWISEGRMALFEMTMQNLLAGYIKPSTLP